LSSEKEREDLSRLLAAASAGDQRAADAIVPLVYDELRAIAAAQLRRMRPGATLEATALVNEAYLRLVGRDAAFASRAHFFFAAARAMRDVLVEHARRGSRRNEIHRERAEEKRDGPPSVADTMLAIDELLPKLRLVDERAHDVVLLRFFGGLEHEQVAEVLGVATRTVERDWRFARSWLYDALSAVGGLPERATIVASE
jgi:RNA polymerase sigma factor (TIGR02999 family)